VELPIFTTVGCPIEKYELLSAKAADVVHADFNQVYETIGGKIRFSLKDAANTDKIATYSFYLKISAKGGDTYYPEEPSFLKVECGPESAKIKTPEAIDIPAITHYLKD
jgi:hypothetical protein